MSLDTAGLRVLTRAECLHLLRTVKVGRVAVSHRALPMILPVHFRVADDDSIRIERRRHHAHRRPPTPSSPSRPKDPPARSDPDVERHRARCGHAPGVASLGHPGQVDVAIGVDEVTGREVLDTAGPMAVAVTSALPRW